MHNIINDGDSTVIIIDENMKKGVTPSNYKDLVQKRLVADIFKTPGQQQQDELSEVQFNNTTRQSFQGAEDETVQLPSQTSVWTSTPVAKTVIPRPKITESLIQHQTDHSTSQKTTGTPLRTPQSFFKPSTVKLVPSPSSLPAATVPIPHRCVKAVSKIACNKKGGSGM